MKDLAPRPAGERDLVRTTHHFAIYYKESEIACPQNPGVERSVKKYEERCPVLAPKALEFLSKLGAQRDTQLSEYIEFAEARIREQHVTLGRATDQKNAGLWGPPSTWR